MQVERTTKPDEARHLKALSIQAAAVAAQQTALGEEEARLVQERLALVQQREQLSGHLEEKRRRLVELRDQCQDARVLVQEERLLHARHVAAVTNDIETSRMEVAAGQEQVRSQRRRLSALRRRLRQRLHRHWLACQEASRRNQAALEEGKSRLREESNRIKQERERFIQERAEFHGEAELSKRRIQTCWQELREAEHRWEAQRQHEEIALNDSTRAAQEITTATAQAEAALARERREWQASRMNRIREAQGLENRIAGLRAQLLNLEAQAALKSAAACQRDEVMAVPSGPESAVPSQSVGNLAMHDRAAVLDQIAEELADQRCQLLEQWEKLESVKKDWQRQTEIELARLEASAKRVAEREQIAAAHEREMRKRQFEQTHWRRQLEAWQAQITWRALAWEGERERWRAEYCDQEQLLQQQLALLGELRRRWHRRQRAMVKDLHSKSATCEALRQEYAVLREQYVVRGAALARQERRLIEQQLAVEQCRQEIIVQAPDPVRAERKLALYHRRLTELCAAEMERLAGEEQKLHHELSILETRAVEAHKKSSELTSRAPLALRSDMSREHHRALATMETDKLRQQVNQGRTREASYERQIKELTDEIQRLVLVLLAEADAESLRLSKAA
jgi:hypothetical protein